jgi:hypothetical protein
MFHLAKDLDEYSDLAARLVELSPQVVASGWKVNKESRASRPLQGAPRYPHLPYVDDVAL